MDFLQNPRLRSKNHRGKIYMEKGLVPASPLRNRRSQKRTVLIYQAENRPFLEGAVYFRLLNSNSVTINAPNVSIKLSASNTVTGFTPLLGRVSRPP